MAVARYYSSNAVDTTLAAGISSSSTSIVVSSVSGFPASYPYTLAIDYDTSNEELVDVTAAAGTTLTVTRAVDSTTAVAHSSGAVIKHALSGRDMRESQEHFNATGYYSVANGATTEYFNLHGLGVSDGNVVGTLATQTVTNKTLTSPTINGATLGGTTTNTGTITGGTINASTATTATTATTTTGNAGTATKLATARNINGTSFDGSADVTVTAAAGTLTGTTLASGVTTSSLTSFGSSATLTSPTINGATINAASTIGGISGTTIAADHGAWQTSWTPTISGTGWALGTGANAGTITGSYIQVGKTVHFKGSLKINTSMTIGSTSLTISLPVASVAADLNGYYSLTGTGRCTLTSYANNGTIVCSQTTTTTFVPQIVFSSASGSSASRVGIDNAYTKAANDNIIFSGTYEAA
jgi:hypothetical protein